MTWLLFSGCSLIAFSPAVIIFVLFIAKSSQLVVLSVGSSFFWLCSVLLSSTTWLIFLHLRSEYIFILFYSVLIQESMRIVFYTLFLKAERRGFTQGVSTLLFSPFKSSSSYNRLDRTRSETEKRRERVMDYFSSALAIGLGFGVTHSMIMYGSILAHASGRGNLMSEACGNISVFVLSAIMAVAFTVMHVFLSLCAFDALCAKKWIDLIWKFGVVVAAHLLLSLLTLLNQKGGSCIASIVLVYAVLLGMGGYTFRVVYSSLSLVHKLPAAIN